MVTNNSVAGRSFSLHIIATNFINFYAYIHFSNIPNLKIRVYGRSEQQAKVPWCDWFH